jgi:predicted transcriptional regulator
MTPQTFSLIETKRARFGISQTSLCRKAGINEATYFRAKSGKSPRVATVQKLGAALACLIGERVEALKSQMHADECQPTLAGCQHVSKED